VADAPTISVCICTRNRPEELARALASVGRSGRRADQVVVADDSTGDETRALVERDHPGVRYVRGPRAGLGQNRNRALAEVTGTLVCFIDDDVLLGPDYFERALTCRAQAADPEGAIVTGAERQPDRLVQAHEQSFLGFQHRPYRPGEAMATIVINSTLFPTRLFREIRFDPRLVYGYDEVDLTTRAVARGYEIVSCPAAVNEHHPSPANRDYYRPYVDASRLYVTFKRYGRTEHRRLRAAAFLVAAPLHLAAARVKADGPGGLRPAARSLRLAAGYALGTRSAR